MTRRVGIVFGTYNRLELLKRAITSARASVGALDYRMFIVDGGSTDGTKDWLRYQVDVALIEQTGPLTGAVRAFNLGFAAAVEGNFDFVVHLNDDAEIVTPGAIERAIELLLADDKIGEVAFEFDLRGSWGFEHVNGMLYANFGVIRREAGMAVARAQGDPSGRDWWNPIYKTYGADTEFGVWLWKLGWRVQHGVGLRVHDVNAKDALRAGNEGKNADSPLFWSRWKDARFGPDLSPELGLPAAPEGSDAYCTWLTRFIHEHQINTIVDLACRHLTLPSAVDLRGARYCGADADKARVERSAEKYPQVRFKCRDIRTWIPRDTDLILCKDVLQHWSNADVRRWLKRLDSHDYRFRYALVTNDNYGASVNVDTLSNGWRAVDLTAPPFSRGEVVLKWGNKDVVLVRSSRHRR